jgi:precorrin-4/cobalt-precorrin-4 C11-methyltransferase
MTVHFVGAGPGDPELLTVRALRLIQTAKICIFAGSLVTSMITDILPDECEHHNSANLTLDQILQICAKASSKNLDVVRLHSGDPSIYGAIQEQMQGLDAIGINYDVTPGISAFQASAAALQVELTTPEHNQTIVLSRVGDRTTVPEYQNLSQLAKLKATLCLYLSIKKISYITNELTPVYGANCPVVVVEKVSWPEQRIIQGTLSNIGDKIKALDVRSTAMIMVGDAINSSYQPKSRLYSPNFSHKFRKAKAT